jgi:hypothetical protein
MKNPAQGRGSEAEIFGHNNINFQENQGNYDILRRFS